MRNSPLFNRDFNVVFPMTTFPFFRRKWEDITANEISHKYELGHHLSNLSGNWFVTKIAMTEKQMGQFIGDWYVRSWDLRSWSKEEIPSLTEIGLIMSGREAIRHDLKVLPEFLQHVMDTLEEIWSSLSWWVMSLLLSIGKQFHFYRECSFNLKSILETGLIAVGKDSREGRQTVFFTPLDPWRDETEETFQGDLSKPREVHHKTEWKRAQDAVYWIHLAKALEKSITFWQTKSHVIFAHETVPPDCIERVISQNGETTLYQRLSAPRPAPRIILTIAWNQQQRQQQQQGDLGGFRKLKRETHQGENNSVREAAGNSSENNVVREEDPFQGNLPQFMECHKTSSTRTRSGWPKYRHLLISCKMDIAISKSTTMKAKVHLGPNYNENLVKYRDTNFEELKTFFDIAQRLISNHGFDILNVSTIEWQSIPWMRSTLSHDRVIKWAKAKSTRLLRFSSMSGKDVRASGSKCKMDTENNLKSMENQSTCPRIHKTIHDGHDGKTAACREFSKLREDPESKIKTWIECFTKLGAVLQVTTTCCLDIHGIEIHIAFYSRHNRPRGVTN